MASCHRITVATRLRVSDQSSLSDTPILFVTSATAATVFSRESAEPSRCAMVEAMNQHIGAERLCLVDGVLQVVAFLLSVVELRLGK